MQDRNLADYRPCVGMVIFNKDGKVFVGRRIDNSTEAWQLPQGGIDDGEDFRTALFREMREEIGTDKAEIIAEYPIGLNDWLYYDLPTEMQGRLWGGKFKGQRQRWFACRFTGEDSNINISTEEPEFCEWQWVDLATIPKLIVPFKKALYVELVAAFQQFSTLTCYRTRLCCVNRNFST